MRFEIVLGYQVNSQFIAKAVQPRIIRVMTGSYCVDVVLLHENKILQDHVPADPCPAAVAAELMAVHAFENDTLPVQAHQPVFHFKTPETDAFVDVFNSGACFGVSADHRRTCGMRAEISLSLSLSISPESTIRPPSDN